MAESKGSKTRHAASSSSRRTKCCCSPCAVYQAQGCKCPEMWFAMAMGCWYTMLCWDPSTGIKNCTMATVTEKDVAPPASVEIVR